MAHEIRQRPDHSRLGRAPGGHPDADDVDRAAQVIGQPIAVAEAPWHEQVAATDDDRVLVAHDVADGSREVGPAWRIEHDTDVGHRPEVLAEDLEEQLVAVVAGSVEPDQPDTRLCPAASRPARRLRPPADQGTVGRDAPGGAAGDAADSGGDSHRRIMPVRLPVLPFPDQTQREALMDRDGFRDWLQRYVDAWRLNDPVAIGDLFSADVRYAYDPFDEALVGPAGRGGLVA